jgi:tripartite-type tricarboxylate transporter receptor subunit TctC
MIALDIVGSSGTAGHRHRRFMIGSTRQVSRRGAGIIIATAFAGCLLGYPQTSWSQSFPSQPIRIVVPFAPGGNLDVTARIVAPLMSEILGQPVVVENRPGAGGMIGAGAVTSSKPDGYTLLMGSTSTLSVGPNVFPNWPHHPINGITPISKIQIVPFVLVVKADSAIRTVGDLVKLAKEKPGEITQAHPGIGSSNHLVSELFQLLTGTKFILVPYRGAGPAMNDLVAGQVHTFFDQATTSVPQVEGGTIRALAVTAAMRLANLPDTPTFAEAGVSNFEILNVAGLVGPAGMDASVTAKLHGATAQVLAHPKVKEAFSRLGVEVVGSTPEEFATFIKEDLDRWSKVIKEADVKVR